MRKALGRTGQARAQQNTVSRVLPTLLTVLDVAVRDPSVRGRPCHLPDLRAGQDGGLTPRSGLLPK